jgi:hypothetical protein
MTKEVSGRVNGDKVIRAGRFDYALDEGAGKDIATIAAQLRQALADKTTVEVPVVEKDGTRMRLFLNCATIDVVVVDLGEGGPRPGEMS